MQCFNIDADRSSWHTEEFFCADTDSTGMR